MTRRHAVTALRVLLPPICLLLALGACGRQERGGAGYEVATTVPPSATLMLARPTVAAPPPPTTAPVPLATATGGAPPPPTPRPTVIVPEVAGHPAVEPLLAALRAHGVAPQPFAVSALAGFTAPGQAYRLGDDIGREQLFLHVYADGGAAGADAAHLRSILSAPNLDWIAPPHFFLCDTVIAAYLGRDARVLDALTARCGPQFAGQP